MANSTYTVSQDRNSGLWYCHMKGFPYIPCFGSFCETKTDAMEYARMYNGLKHNVDRVERKKKGSDTNLQRQKEHSKDESH